MVEENENKEQSGQKSSEKSSEKTVEKIIRLLNENPQYTQTDLIRETGLSRRGVEKNLKMLKSRGILERIGADKGDY
jgi:ATP-dependent DNA helicase RecG